MWWTWDLTVASSMESSPAISLLARPRAISLKTSVSLSVSASGFSGARTSRIRRAAASGASRTWPEAADLIASHSSSASGLQEVADSPRPDGRRHRSVLKHAGERDHLHLGHLAPNLPSSLYAVHHRHEQVHQDHVGAQDLRHLYGLFAI